MTHTWLIYTRILNILESSVYLKNILTAVYHFPLMNTNVDNQEAAIKCLDLPSNLLGLHLKKTSFFEKKNSF